MEVFRIVFDKCTTVANAVKGFKKSGVFPWDRMIINDKKLAPSTMFENQSHLPDVNMSMRVALKPVRNLKKIPEDRI